jgi:biotin synthase
VTTDWNALADKVIDGGAPTREEALAVLQSEDDELLAVMHAAFRVRSHFHGRTVKIHLLQNAKSGVCPEDCAFCSQSLHYDNEVEQYNMQTVEDLLEGAERAYESGASTYCMVTSTRGPTNKELRTVVEAVRRIKEKYPLQICASLGLLKEGQAEELAAGGVDRYNHNIETSKEHFEKVVSTHTWESRVETVQRAKDAGMEACCGGIMGMGEDDEDRVDLAFALREIGVESVPLNFLDPRPGTPMQQAERLTPNEALRALAMFRFVHPDADVRIAGGREVTLGKMQPLALYAANSFFTDGYLTTGGAEPHDDAKLLEQAGFVGKVIGGEPRATDEDIADEVEVAEAATDTPCARRQART